MSDEQTPRPDQEDASQQTPSKEGSPDVGSTPPEESPKPTRAEPISQRDLASQSAEQDKEVEADESQTRPPRRKILIGSQRNPAKYRPRPRKDWKPIVARQTPPPPPTEPTSCQTPTGAVPPPQPPAPVAPTVETPPQPPVPVTPSQPPAVDAPPQPPAAVTPPQPPAVEARPQQPPATVTPPQPPAPVTPPQPPAVEAPPPPPQAVVAPPPAPVAETPPRPPAPVPPAEPTPSTVVPAIQTPPSPTPSPADILRDEIEALEQDIPAETDVAEAMGGTASTSSTGRVALPSKRAPLEDDLEAELAAAMGDASVDDLMSGEQVQSVSRQTMFETDSKHTVRVLAVQRGDVFVELGGREQGVIPLLQFDEEATPEVGSTIDARVVRFNREDGLYELALPTAAVSVGDWDDLDEGMVVVANITGHNTGGLECEVNHLRGFIPISQISLYRVENLEEFVGEKFKCVVTECNPQRRNLVLSHRDILEREREEARQKMLDSLAPGQTHEGVVRKLMDFGAFVDLGGVDGLLHISQLSWSRVKHPSDVVEEGQRISVRIESVDIENNRISLSYRDLLENPWDNVESNFPVTTQIHGRVTRVAEFGAFVELEPGVEGLVHISELSHKRVWRATDVVKEGEEVDAIVLSIDPENRRISLSMKDLIAPPEAKGKDKDDTPGDAAPISAKEAARQHKGPLKGGIGKESGGEQFGLNW